MSKQTLSSKPIRTLSPELEAADLATLEKIAADTSIEVPSDLGESIRIALDALEFIESSDEEPLTVATAPVRRFSPRRRALTWSLSAAAALALVAGIAFSLMGSQPKDTFSDPYLAYAQIEETFSLISSKMDKGVDFAQQETGTVLAKTSQIIQNM